MKRFAGCNFHPFRASLIDQLLVHFIFLVLFQGSGILPGRGKVEPEHHPNSPGASTTTSDQQNSK